MRVRWALATSMVVAILLPLVMGEWTPLIGLGILLAAWVITTGFADLKRRMGNEGTFMQRLKVPTRSYYGMQLAHLGIAVFILGVTLVKGYESERDVRMDVGDTLTTSGYVFRFDGVTEEEGPNYVAARGIVSVSRDGKPVTVLHPEKRQYNASGMPMTEAAIDTGFLRDLYVSLGEPIPDSEAWAVRIYLKPFVDWIWAGCLLMALGGMLAVTDRRYRIHARKAQTVAIENKEQTA
jgi:cytochrome c-type biogenesis protein CcmF